MSYYVKKLTQLRRQEQEVRGYAASSRWYTGLSNAISFLERAETGDDPLERFRDSWSAAYNLFVMYGKAGDDEFKRFNSWVTDLKEIPEVRRMLTDLSQSSPVSSFLSAVSKTKGKLLKSQGLKELESWEQGSPGPDKSCRYFMTIVRDMRNVCSHPDFNPNSSAIKKALTTAADCLIPLVAAAARSLIERPVEGTTGRTTAYRSFLWPFLKNSDSFFSDYYLERLFLEEELGGFPEEEVKRNLKTMAKFLQSKRSSLMTAGVEGTRDKWCIPILFPALKMSIHDDVRIVSGDAVFEPSYVLKREDLSGSPREEYQGKDAGRDLSCLIWVLSWRSSLDVLSADPAFESLSVMEVAHRALSNSDVPWAVITNGRQLRLLAKRTGHKPRCFLEIDLDAIIDRYTDQESLTAFRYLLGLFSGPSFTKQDQNGRTLLDRVLLGSERHGKEIGDELKQNVFNALEELGDGFLHYLRSQPEELERLRIERAPSLSTEVFLSSEELLNDIYTESLSLMYRLLFLFYAESRNMLPMEDDMYRETYSLESIRDDIISVHDDPDPKRFFGQGDTILWDRLKELFEFVNRGWRKVIPVYDGGLFDTELHEFLERFKVPDYFLARAIDLLSRTQPRSGQARGEGRKKVTYRDLDIRHLGSIYEGILEYSAHIADQDLVVIKRGSGAKKYEEYIPVSDLKKKEKDQFKLWQEAIAENPDNPKLPRGCKVTGFKEKGSYFLVFGGRESKRKSSGSYYTPDYIVQYIVENTLGPLVRGECRPKPEPLPEALRKLGVEEDKVPAGPLSSEEILQLKVLDPAMGSGHFLVAATEYLARAYGEALVREGKNGDGVITDEEFIRYKRKIAERCIYGVDINPMAVELAKLSMWLFTMDRGRPLSFLNHHLKCGNALIGAWIDDLGELPEIGKKGKLKKKARDRKQRNFFEEQFRAKVPVMIRDLFEIMEQETLSYDDIKAKKALDKAVEDIKRPFVNVADDWVGTFFGEKARDYATKLSNVSLAKDCRSEIAKANRFFHWELEFPEVFFDQYGRKRSDPGFSCYIGNPPYVFARETLRKDEKHFYAFRFEKTSKDKPNLYVMFLDLGVRLSQNKGQIGMIVPNAWLGVDSAEPLRNMLLAEAPPRLCVVCLYPVFEQVSVEPVVSCFERFGRAKKCWCKVQLSPESFGENLYETSIERWEKLPEKKFAIFTSTQAGRLLDGIVNKGVPLGKVSNVKAALQAYEIGKGKPPQTAQDVRNRVFDRTERDAPDTYKYLEGSDVLRYGIKWSGKWLSYGPWLSQPRDIVIFSKPRVLVREVTGRYPRMLIAAPVSELYLNNKSIINVVCENDGAFSSWLIAGILNSKLGSFIFKHTGVKANRGLFPKVVISDLRSFPVPKRLDRAVAYQFEKNVRRMCDAVKKNGREDQNLQKKCDQLVFKLYGLSFEDIQIVENELEVTSNATDGNL
ncbi:MAG: N-6 DNA methylase [Deltaproteobacteria bacterium]|nr:N-6 DNA methylase [Deltaproteobacteria bacterium]